MTTLTKILLENVRSALMIPCDEDSVDVAMTVQVFTTTGQHLLLAGEQAADFWKAWKGKNDRF